MTYTLYCVQIDYDRPESWREPLKLRRGMDMYTATQALEEAVGKLASPMRRMCITPNVWIVPTGTGMYVLWLSFTKRQKQREKRG